MILFLALCSTILSSSSVKMRKYNGRKKIYKKDEVRVANDAEDLKGL